MPEIESIESEAVLRILRAIDLVDPDDDLRDGDDLGDSAPTRIEFAWPTADGGMLFRRVDFDEPADAARIYAVICAIVSRATDGRHALCTVHEIFDSFSEDAD